MYILLAVYIIISLAVTITEVAASIYEGEFILTPKDLRYETDMNWFGCITCYILLCVFAPFNIIIKLIYVLFHI